MRAYRLLRADEIECRVQKCNEKGVSLLLYKTARTDADLLDETVGADKWENDFKLVDGVLYGGIGVDYGNGLVWKWDAGTESNTEAEKGRASDAYKRAGFKHGIGRELYSAPFVWIDAQACRKLKQDNKGRWVCNDKFEVGRIEYDERECICLLEITSGGKAVYLFGNGNQPTNGKPVGSEKVANMHICSRCGHEITPKKCGGKVYTAKDIAENSEKTYGRVLCWDCMTEVRASGDDQ